MTPKENHKSFKRHWICSDIHFSHDKIREYHPETRGNFATVDEMNEEIIRRWNSLVKPEDHSYVLGDLSMGKVANAPPLITRLNGKKTLIKGNHDRSLVKLPEFQTEEGLKKMGIVAAYDYLCFSATNKLDLVMFHFPIASWDGKWRGSYHFHGHLHGAPSGLDGRAMDVGIDTNDLYPYDFNAAVEKLRAIRVGEVDHHGDPIEKRPEKY